MVKAIMTSKTSPTSETSTTSETSPTSKANRPSGYGKATDDDDKCNGCDEQKPICPPDTVRQSKQDNEDNNGTNKTVNKDRIKASTSKTADKTECS